MANPMFKGKGANIIKGSYDANFPLKHAQKDMKLALALATQLSVDMPVTCASNGQYEKVLEECGDEDFSAIQKASFQK